MPNKYPALQPVSSQMFSRAGYDDAAWELYYEFKSTRKIRVYKHIAPEAADAALSAKSIGGYWNANIKGNSTWEFETLGAEEPDTPMPAKQTAIDTLDVMDSDIKLCEPGWNGKTIDPMPPFGPPKYVASIDHAIASEDSTRFTRMKDGDVVQSGKIVNDEQGMRLEPFGPADVFTGPVEVIAPKMMHATEVANWPTKAEIEEDLEHVPQFGDGTVKQPGLTVQLHPELLAAWTAPETAAEALDMLAERDTEIKAIIAQSKATGDQALTIRISSDETRAEASEVLTRLDERKKKTSAALDPFRKVLYEAYGETQAKVRDGVDPLEKGINHIKNQILAWDQAKERERQRLIREDNERRDAEARRLQAAEAERIKLADVTDALEMGDEQRAQTLFDTPLEVPRPYVAPVYIPPAAPKVEGQSTATAWKVDRAAVEDDETGAAYLASITALLRAIKDGSYPIDQAAPLLSWDFAMADKRAGSLMSAFSVPGLQAGPKSTLRVGAGRKKKL